MRHQLYLEKELTMCRKKENQNQLFKFIELYLKLFLNQFIYCLKIHGKRKKLQTRCN